MNDERGRMITRRNLMKRGLLGGAGVMLAGMPGVSQALAAPALLRAKAKSVIQIWMWGGPSHTDTFDPKPDAGDDFTGPFKTPIETNVPGIRINELLPMLAKQADKYSIIRSMTHGINGHETASYIVQTGHKPGRTVFPSVGAVVSLLKGVGQGYKGSVPPYIVLTRGQGRFSEAGFLGQKYKPFATGGDPARDPFAVEGIVAPGITKAQQLKRRELLHSLDALGEAMPDNAVLAELDKREEDAYALMTGDAAKLFDLSNEKNEVRDAYGRNTFGQSCLMARRLVEEGVPYITINSRGWDTHKQHFETLNRRQPEVDQGFATLLQDLHDRGLLDSTIVWWGGEFGRGPKIQWGSPWNGGRSHFGQCFCSVVAGGGFKGGQVVGASNKFGTDVADRPVTPQNMIGSIYQLMGIDCAAAMPNPRGWDVKVMPDANNGDGLLKEIM